MIATLLKVELLKTRRSLALLLMLACPFVVVLLSTGMLLNNPNAGTAKIGLWQGFWMGNFALWCYFMLPMYIALVTALLNANEHRNQTWRLMFAMPVSAHQLYLAKALLAFAFVLGANALLVAFSILAILCISLFGHPLAGAFDFPAGAVLARIALACLPIVLIQHMVSWRFSNIVLPLSLGIFGTLGILQIGSSKHWIYFPWSYSLMAANGGSAQLQAQSLMLAAGLGLALYVTGSAWLARSAIAK